MKTSLTFQSWNEAELLSPYWQNFQGSLKISGQSFSQFLEAVWRADIMLQITIHEKPQATIIWTGKCSMKVKQSTVTLVYDRNITRYNLSAMPQQAVDHWKDSDYRFTQDNAGQAAGEGRRIKTAALLEILVVTFGLVFHLTGVTLLNFWQTALEVHTDN